MTNGKRPRPHKKKIKEMRDRFTILGTVLDNCSSAQEYDKAFREREALGKKLDACKWGQDD